uniref:Probable magnesium-protoporphyrin IX monomethyl ester [oxidative] cyclase n=1 Tax=Cyanidium sp. THAL103 TaxID=3027999 RepID=A0A9Y1I3Y0_9RHOD|nr:magnesium-protoporphyrin IX monomethyl ester cyclase [Cyanidium sp. THAL103]
MEIRTSVKETLLTPRFYTTDFDEISNYDISENLDQINSIINEFRHDYNKRHFIRDKDFDQSLIKLNSAVKILFIEFLERSCTAEFSGFLLYKELARKLKNKNPILAEGFLLMSRDEARHAGFLNKAMSDFNLTLDLGTLTKTRKYTFFKPKFIFYATYLSERIGYWRYITIYRHLEKYSEYRIYPIFKFFENWCQDENRHGDFFVSILKSQSFLLKGMISKLWCRFFLLSVFVTMYLNDFQRCKFYEFLGLDSRQFDIHVIKKTNESAARVFPVVLDLDNPVFIKYLDICACYNQQLVELRQSNSSLFKYCKQLYLSTSLIKYLLKLYFLKPINSEDLWNTIR